MTTGSPAMTTKDEAYALANLVDGEGWNVEDMRKAAAALRQLADGHYICPDCSNQFVQPFKCTTCGAQKLYDHTVASQAQCIASLEAELAKLREEREQAYTQLARYAQERDREERLLRAGLIPSLRIANGPPRKEMWRWTRREARGSYWYEHDDRATAARLAEAKMEGRE